jgi:hypothetical protein
VARAPLSLAVVGADYPNKKGPGRRFEIELCTPGERVELVLEPKNPVDPRAVAVYSTRAVQIGYLTAERCGWLGRMLADGREIRAIFQSKTANGAVIRAAFDGADPILPPATPRPGPANQEEAFWPDPDYPD